MEPYVAPFVETKPPVDITLSLHQKEAVLAIRLVLSILSFVGSVFVLLCMYIYKKYSGPHRLIMMLTICNLGEACTNLLSFFIFNRESERSGLCYFQGLSLQFFQVAAFCWSALIGVNLWLVIVRKRLDVDRYQKYYHFIAWGVTIVCTIIPNFTRAYGLASVWCWINKNAQGGNALRFITFFVPFYISWIIIIICYVWISQVMSSSSKNMRQDEKENALRHINRLRIYPIIFVVLYIPATINRIYNWASQDDIFGLFVFQALTAPAVGFVNAIAYGLDVEIRNKFANICIRRGWCSYCLGDVELPENIGTGPNQFNSTTDFPLESGFTYHQNEDDDIIIEEVVLDERGNINPQRGRTPPANDVF